MPTGLTKFVFLFGVLAGCTSFELKHVSTQSRTCEIGKECQISGELSLIGDFPYIASSLTLSDRSCVPIIFAEAQANSVKGLDGQHISLSGIAMDYIATDDDVMYVYYKDRPIYPRPCTDPSYALYVSSVL